MLSNLNLKYLSVEEVYENSVLIYLKDTIYPYNFCILFGVGILGIPFYSTTLLFKDIRYAKSYILNHFVETPFSDYDCDFLIDLKGSMFNYPLSGLVEYNLIEGLTLHFKTDREKKKLLKLLDRKLGYLIRFKLRYV